MKKLIGISIIAASLLTAGLVFAATTPPPTGGSVPAITSVTPGTPMTTVPTTMPRPGQNRFMFRRGPQTGMAMRFARPGFGSFSGLRFVADGITLLLLWIIMILFIMLLVKRLKRHHDREHYRHEHPEQK